MNTSKDDREEKEVSFPSPARDFWEPPLSLDKECNLSNPSVFLLRYQGVSRPYIKPRAVLIVDRSLKPKENDTVVVARAGELELHIHNQIPEEQDIELWGTVTHVVNPFRAL